jgi:hypothetical protein
MKFEAYDRQRGQDEQPEDKIRTSIPQDGSANGKGDDRDQEWTEDASNHGEAAI